MISVWVQFLLGLQVGNGTFDAQILEIGLVHEFMVMVPMFVADYGYG
jgi:hypothetical protein